MRSRAILKRLLKGKTNQKVVLLTKKKDRSLTLETQDGALTLIEQGYLDTTWTRQLTGGAAKHELGAAFKREFPRSHQLYIRQG